VAPLSHNFFLSLPNVFSPTNLSYPTQLHIHSPSNQINCHDQSFPTSQFSNHFFTSTSIFALQYNRFSTKTFSPNTTYPAFAALLLAPHGGHVTQRSCTRAATLHVLCGTLYALWHWMQCERVCDRVRSNSFLFGNRPRPDNQPRRYFLLKREFISTREKRWGNLRRRSSGRVVQIFGSWVAMKQSI
jgi:hypothetical protein